MSDSTVDAIIIVAVAYAFETSEAVLWSFAGILIVRTILAIRSRTADKQDHQS